MAPVPPIRVVLCDDAVEFRALLRALLGSDPRIEVVGEASDGEEGLAVAVALRPDVLLLDITMPVLDGLAALPRLRDAVPGTAVIACSSHPAEEMTPKVLERGAVAYVQKDAAPRALRDAVLAAAGRGA